jgi:hypothetical protein
MIKPLTVDAMEISGVQSLDPVQVYWEDFGEGRGRVTITCYGEAWTGYWIATGEITIKQFFLSCDDDYLANRIQGAQFQKRNPGHLTYLKRIVRAIKEAIREEDDLDPGCLMRGKFVDGLCSGPCPSCDKERQRRSA